MKLVLRNLCLIAIVVDTFNAGYAMARYDWRGVWWALSMIVVSGIGLWVSKGMDSEETRA